MKLPNPENAIVEISKLRNYCLNEDHEEGKHKARVFAAALGIVEKHADWRRERLLDAARTAEASLVSETPFGLLYMLDFDLATSTGAGIVRRGENIPRLTTCYVRKKQ